MQCFVGGIAVGDMMKSTLGPSGMDKILQPMGGEGAHLRKTNVTNDGATILKSIWLDNPAAKILVGSSTHFIETHLEFVGRGCASSNSHMTCQLKERSMHAPL